MVSTIPPSSPIDSEALAAELSATIRGEVRFDAGSRGLYAHDGSNYRQVPIGVVIPRDADDVVATVAATPGLRHLAKAIIGIPAERQLPVYATETFRTWFAKRGAHNPDRPPVILWPDTFTNYFQPGIAKAAVEVLEAAGYQVQVPLQPLCCGRPLYEFGMLGRAQRLLRQILDSLGAPIAAGVPLIGLEPACTSVFRDELLNLFPHDEQAKRLNQQTYLLSEFLQNQAEHYEPPTLEGKALVHGHCHHKSIMSMEAEEQLLAKLGLDFQVLDSGCCGMAGSFGYEKAKYDVSIKAGERVLLPTVREAAKDTLIITDGYSCREQIAHATDRRALHLAQVLRMALDHKDSSSTGDYPERGYL